MTDPFEALQLPVIPVAPDPNFTTALRARIERALTLPKGVAVSTTTTAPKTASTTTNEAATTATLGAAIPYLAVRDARAAIRWYADVFGAELSYDPIVMPDGRIGHCELRLSGGLVFMADEHPEIGVVAPSPDASAVSLMLRVDDADRVRAAALERGASGDREVYDAHGQRNAWIIDPFGHRWGLSSPLPAPTESGTRPGDVVYAWLAVPDGDRAAAFYADVLGWTPRRRGEGYHVEGAPSIGIGGGSDERQLFCCYAVDDLDAARERVVAAGGTAGDAERRPYGLTADCTDDQGTAFALLQITPGETYPASVRGALAYITHDTPDSRRFRDFYGAVLGWTFSPGRVDDGWQIEGTTPMGGVAGGQAAGGAVPMWQVDNIAAAVARVPDAGGTASEPQRQPYGLMAECTDDQGTRFYLGQL